MPRAATEILDLPLDVRPEPDELIQAAMQWHFSPETGSPFWLERARTLPFDPRTDVKSHDDLALFPNVTGELRDVRAQDLIPRGYGHDSRPSPPTGCCTPTWAGAPPGGWPPAP